MKSTVYIFLFHLVTGLVMTFFEGYFIYNIFAKYTNIITSPYLIGLLLGVLLLVITYLLYLKKTSTLINFVPSIIGAIILIIVAVFYIWNTQYFDGTGYFFICVFLLPYLVLSAAWSLIGWLLAGLQEENQSHQYSQNQTAQAE